MKTAVVGTLVILGCSLLAGQADPDSPKPAKPGKIYHVGGDVKPPRAISSPQPVPDDNKEKIGSGAAKKVVKEGASVLSIVIGEDGSVRRSSSNGSLYQRQERVFPSQSRWRCRLIFTCTSSPRSS